MVAQAATHPSDELHESYDVIVCLRELATHPSDELHETYNVMVCLHKLRLNILMSCMNLVASAAGLFHESPTTLEVQAVGLMNDCRLPSCYSWRGCGRAEGASC